LVDAEQYLFVLESLFRVVDHFGCVVFVDDDLVVASAKF